MATDVVSEPATLYTVPVIGVLSNQEHRGYGGEAIEGRLEAALHKSYAFLNNVLRLYPVPEELPDWIMLGSQIDRLFDTFLHGFAGESDIVLASATTAS